MPHLNYQHLRYFWVVAREGGVTAAAEHLSVSPSTISVQLRKLEEQFDQPLFVRAGRNLELNETGRVAFRYANSIFSTGEELKDYLRGRRQAGPLRLTVGLDPVIPKLISWRLIEPATTLDTPCHIVCREASPSELVDELLLHQLDVILSDVALDAGPGVQLFNDLLGESTISLCAAPELAAALRPDFPASLDGAPVLLPSVGTEMRRSLDRWFSAIKVRPQVVAEFDDLALLDVAGEHGLGVIPVPTVVVEEVRDHFVVDIVGLAEGVIERFYAVSVKREVEHPAVHALTNRAKSLLR